MDAALEQHFNLIASYVALAIECGAVFVVAFGALQAMAALLKAIANGQATGLAGRQIWLRFATWILLALEFALAADILRTAVAPTWDDISKLAVIATIRTMLNYFLAKEISDPSSAPFRLAVSPNIPWNTMHPPSSSFILLHSSARSRTLESAKCTEPRRGTAL